MEFVLLGSEVGGISGMDARLRFDLQKERETVTQYAKGMRKVGMVDGHHK